MVTPIWPRSLVEGVNPTARQMVSQSNIRSDPLIIFQFLLRRTISAFSTAWVPYTSFIEYDVYKDYISKTNEFYKTRQQAKEQAIYRAFEILEEQINGTNKEDWR